MAGLPKLTEIAHSIKLSQTFWQEKIYRSWALGKQNGDGFAIGDANDQPKVALTKEGYELIAEIEGMAIGTDGLTKIVAVINSYGPWAVDITDSLVFSNFSQQQLSLATKQAKTKNRSKS